MATFTDSELDAVEAAFEKAEAENDAASMHAIMQTPAHAHVAVRRAKEQMENGLLRRGGSVEDRLDRLAYFAMGERVMASAQAKLMAAAMRALEARIAELEKAPLRYDGPHETGKTYRKGTFVTHAGSVWHANRRTAAKPGDGSDDWTLAIKRGRNGRDR